MAQKITPNLWFDHNAKEAVEFYCTAFPDSSITKTDYYPKTQEEGLADFQLEYAGKELSINFELSGHSFVAINAGNEFKFNPATSFMLNFDPASDDKAEEHLEQLWSKLSEDGTALMPLDAYPFSKKYGWVQDKYGLSWQLILTDPNGEPRPFIIPSFLFNGEMTNRAEEAIKFYVDVFQAADIGNLARYEEDTGPAHAGSLMFGDFMLSGQWFAAMDSAVEQTHVFNESISFSIACADQDEIDYFWSKLSVVPESEQCGWCKDKFGISWQIVPANMDELMQRPDAFAKMMRMKKIVIDEF